MFTLEIKTDNAAFGDGDSHTDCAAEVARILRELADKLDNLQPSGTVRDSKGNTVG